MSKYHFYIDRPQDLDLARICREADEDQHVSKRDGWVEWAGWKDYNQQSNVLLILTKTSLNSVIAVRTSFIDSLKGAGYDGLLPGGFWLDDDFHIIPVFSSNQEFVRSEMPGIRLPGWMFTVQPKSEIPDALAHIQAARKFLQDHRTAQSLNADGTKKTRKQLRLEREQSKVFVSTL